MAEHSNLPAPYESPWRQLGRAVAAVLASLRLDARGLWRRNRAGELPRPIWWPRDLVPLFWPLLLVAGLALAVALALAALSGLKLLQHPPAPPPPTQLLVEPQLPAEPQRPQQPQPQAAAPEPAPTPTPEPAPAPAPAPDPLLAALAQGDSQDLISAVSARPDQGLLQLQLSPAYAALTPRQQRRWADTWLAKSQEMGFEQLELLGSDGRTLGYRARVGSGMILLDPDSMS